jgi:cytochrome c oxidase assembly protein subunit 15
VEWQPLVGVVPPLDRQDWLTLFDKYKASPQYRESGAGMGLQDFQRIFFWEYVHRLWGRLIGVAVLVPGLYFLWRRRLTRSLAWKTVALFVLGGLQGLLGWFMVQSGLTHEPRVSHYRLAAHLLLAFVTGGFALWLALDGYAPRIPARRAPQLHLRLALGLLALLAVQSIYGAFMAGTRAGYYYATFPDMHGSYGPGPFFTGDSLLHDAFNSPPAIHYLHRFFGWATLCYAFGLWAFLQRVAPRASVRQAAALVGAITFLQFNLGAMTMLHRVKLPIAVAHQVMTYLLLSCALVLLHRVLGSQAQLSESVLPGRS